MTDRARELAKAALLIGLTACFAKFVEMRDAYATPPAGDADYRDYKVRSAVEVRGVFRDFLPKVAAGGHPDFGLLAPGGRGVYFHVAAETLDADSRPVFATSGQKRVRDWLDASQRPICATRSYIGAVTGDLAGATESGAGGVVTSAATFAQWFRDGAPARSHAPMPFVLSRDGSRYSFDGSFDTIRPGGEADYNYTYELDTHFIYERNAAFYLSIQTTCDAWAFVDDKLVIESAKSGALIRPALAVDDTIVMTNSALIIGGTGGSVSTNSTASSALRVSNSAKISGDALVGPGGNAGTGISTDRASAVTGDRGVLPERVPINIVAAPNGMPASTGDLTLDGQTVTWDRDLHVRNLRITRHAQITVRGVVRVLADAAFSMEISSKIIVPAGSRLEIYALGDITIDTSSEVNVSAGDPASLMIACLGVGKRILVDNRTFITGSLIAPSGRVEIGNHATVYGSITARSALLQNNCTLRGDTGSGAEGGAGGVMAAQRIDLNRLAWLTHGNTHRLRIFFANRTGVPSRAVLHTNITTLNLARLPINAEPGHD